MIKAFKQYFGNLKFQKKIIGVSLTISLIPILLLGLFAYTQIQSLLIDREETALLETLQLESVQLDYKLDSYLTTMNHIVWNETIRTSLAKDYDTSADMYLTYRDIIDPLFLTIRSLNHDITAITIYTDGSIYPHGNVLRPLTEVQNQDWYNLAADSTTPFFYLSEDTKDLYLICHMYYNSHVPYTNIICITIDLPSLMQPVHKLLEGDYGFLLTNASGNVIYEYTDAPSIDSLSGQTPEVLIHSRNSDYIIKNQSLENADWIAFLYRPVDSVSVAAKGITYIVFIMIFICIALIFFASAGLSKIIVTPIERLSASMEQVEQGNYEISISSNNTDEIGQLIQSFKKMVHTLNNLVNEVLRAKIAQQKYEIEILQSQINPHFLYNSLSLINSKAIMSGQKDISHMAQLLSKFYRTMLNKGQQITTISSELENTRSYISIQQMMHSNSFDVVYDIDESVLEYRIPNLLLQPLAENAILHGLDHRELPGQAILSMSCWQEDNDILFKVMDNGCGMTEEQCKQILSTASKGYGIKNVHQRIQLYYGTRYGLSYHSTKGMGTYVILKISKDL